MGGAPEGSLPASWDHRTAPRSARG